MSHLYSAFYQGEPLLKGASLQTMAATPHGNVATKHSLLMTLFWICLLEQMGFEFRFKLPQSFSLSDVSRQYVP